MSSLILLSLFPLCLSGALRVAPSEPKTIYNHFVTNRKEVALTFDDGPDRLNTLKVLDCLDRLRIKATFFMLGENVVKNQSAASEVLKRGHQIGLHTYSHPNLHKLRYEQIKEEVVKNQEALAKVIGYKPQLIRPPYGIVTNDFLKVAQELNLTIYTWSSDSFDWKKSSDQKTIVKNATAVKPGSIILMHDRSANQHNSLLALPVLIKELARQGYGFIKLGRR